MEMLTAREIVLKARGGNPVELPAYCWNEFKMECQMHCDARDLVAVPKAGTNNIIIKKENSR
jgi:hypothetical protein